MVVRWLRKQQRKGKGATGLFTKAMHVLMIPLMSSIGFMLYISQVSVCRRYLLRPGTGYVRSSNLTDYHSVFPPFVLVSPSTNEQGTGIDRAVPPLGRGWSRAVATEAPHRDRHAADDTGRGRSERFGTKKKMADCRGPVAKPKLFEHERPRGFNWCDLISWHARSVAERLEIRARRGYVFGINLAV